MYKEISINRVKFIILIIFSLLISFSNCLGNDVLTNNTLVGIHKAMGIKLKEHYKELPVFFRLLS